MLHLMMILVLTFANDDKEVSPLLTAEERHILVETNKAREKHHLPPLVLNPKLTAAARLHSNNMAEQKKMSHKLQIPGQRTVKDRLRYVDYDWSNVGENVAQGYSYSRVVDGWMKSPGHRANILGRFTEIGIGIAKDSDGQYYYTQVFAKPSQRRAIRRARVLR